ncbi:type II toxin-antitoxin system VapB family antitoxin [Mesorhizobium sp. M0977]|uniref:type II toxin-antitoxin system VapB family antitoxin n=1 Tax=Mesorhizobium sp. M0977 TaxID=2957039 RepID=UPI003338A48B
MPLFIRDPDVDAMAVELQHITNARSKTEAVRTALRYEIERNRGSVPLRERLAKVKEMARRIGPANPDFDMKKFTDQMWSDD